MNVNFKVLWFEDEMGWRPSSERSMKRIIESHNLVPIITWCLLIKQLIFSVPYDNFN